MSNIIYNILGVLALIVTIVNILFCIVMLEKVTIVFHTKVQTVLAFIILVICIHRLIFAVLLEQPIFNDIFAVVSWIFGTKVCLFLKDARNDMDENCNK